MEAGKKGMAPGKVRRQAEVSNRQTKTPGIKAKREQAKRQSPKSKPNVKNWQQRKTGRMRNEKKG